jgi:hypothetical protein
MSSALTVKDCSHCPIETWDPITENYRCQLNDKKVVRRSNRPDWCPLPLTLEPAQETRSLEVTKAELDLVEQALSSYAGDKTLRDRVRGDLEAWK